jgi:hypothetical protein
MMSATFVDGAKNLSVQVDGNKINNLQRVQSDVFEVALAENNIFDSPCNPLNVPAGIYSFAVDDGYYVGLELKAGHHTLHIHGHTDEEDHWFRRMATIYSDR